jgi:hypothetical protein
MLLAAEKISRMDEVKSLLAKYYPLERYPAGALYALEELLSR